MKKKKIVIALGHDALGTTLPEQKEATKRTAKAVADFIREDYQVVITHSNGPQVGMIHTAMNEFCRLYPEYTATPMSVCSAMSQGYIGYDLQNAIRTELLNRGIYKTVSTVLTQVVVDPYDEAFYHPAKVIGRVMTKEEAEEELKTVYSSKGRKLDAAFALMMMGTYHLLTTHSNIKPKSNIIRLTLDFLELLDLASENDDENNLNAKIACLEKRNYTPKWDMKPQDIYRTSPNNHTNETINFRLW